MATRHINSFKSSSVSFHIFHPPIFSILKGFLDVDDDGDGSDDDDDDDDVDINSLGSREMDLA